MIYNEANTIDIGNPVERVVDANGTSYDRGLKEVDTETGRIRRYAMKDGEYLSEPGKNKLRIEEFYAPAPLTVIFRAKT